MITYLVTPFAPAPAPSYQGYAAWRIRQVSVQEATYDVGEPFRWLQFCGRIEPGDTMWFFKSPPVTWANNVGKSGYLIMRGGRVFDVFTTVES